MAIYNIYDIDDDRDLLVTASEQECIDTSKLFIGTGVAESAQVFIFENLNSRDDYYEFTETMDVSRDGGYTLKNFLKLAGLAPAEHIKIAGHGALEYENLHHLGEDEQLEVVKWIPDELLVNELLRRLKEYRGASDGVMEVFDNMKIYV